MTGKTVQSRPAPVASKRTKWKTVATVAGASVAGSIFSVAGIAAPASAETGPDRNCRRVQPPPPWCG